MMKRSPSPITDSTVGADTDRRRRRGWLPSTLAVVLILLMIGMVGCGGDGDQDIAADGDDTTEDGPPATIDLAGLVGSSWTLRAGGGPDGDIPIVDGWPITLTFDEDTLGGTAACNGYGGTYAIEGNSLFIDELAWTEMGCQPDVQASEQAFLGALVDVDGIDVVGDELALSGPSTELIFTANAPVPTEELVGTLWLLESLIQGDAASSVRGDPATLFLDAGGSLTGGTGCRSLSGRYVIAGNSVEFVEFAADGDCPTSLKEQDNQVVTVLGDGFTVEIDGDRLMATSAGNEGLHYRAITEDELEAVEPIPAESDAELLAGIDWVFTAGYGDPEVADPANPDEITIPDPRSVDPNQPITLTFIDGSYEGMVICNPYGGAAEIFSGTLELGVPAAEEEGCGGGLDAIAADYLAALPLMTEFGVEGDGERLVMNGSGVELHFERST